MKAKRFFIHVIATFPMWLFLSCERKYVPPGGISTYLTGEWLLEKVVTPSGTTIPNGYYQTLVVDNDGRFDYVSIRRNQVEVLRENEVRGSSYADVKNYTVDIRYQNGKMLRYFLFLSYENGVLQGVKQMQVTEFMKEYSAEADTVRYFYRR